MGMIIPARNFSGDIGSGLLKPIIYCCPYKDAANAAVPINLLLAEKLAACRPNRRTMRIETFFHQILAPLPDEAVIKDFDVMFHPDYRVDVLRMMTVVCKKKPFRAIWPGTYENGTLFYAKDGCPDFKVFSVEEYDVTCIV